MSIEYISPIITGIATALSITVIIFCWNTGRTKWLGWRIKNIIRNNISPAGEMKTENKKFFFDKAGVTIDNNFYFPITVRSVWANVGSDGKISLVYNGPQFKEDLLPSRKVSEDNIYGFVELPAYTNGTWVIDRSYIQKQKQIQNRITGYTVHVEFQTYFNVPKVVKIEIDKPESLSHINNLIDECNSKLNSGGA